ncbi:hypothetical protein BH23GEM11_BH23GEM11_01510 [soil metagenome]
MNRPHIQIGVMTVPSPRADVDALRAVARRATEDITTVLENVTHAAVTFHMEMPGSVPDDDPRRAADFLNDASLRMVEQQYDAMLVFTSVPIVSRRERIVPGLASELARVAVLSARRLQGSGRGKPPHELGSDAVRWNAAALLLHLMGHLLGLEHAKGGDNDGEGPGDLVMAPFLADHERRGLPGFSEDSKQRLPALAARFPERVDRDEGTWSELRFHAASALRHPRQALLPVLRSWAPFLPLRLPRLATAALAPALILVFTAEIWDAGFHMTSGEVWSFAFASILLSTLYLLMAQKLFLPHKERRYHTEHLAVVNVGILLAVLAAAAGLFAMLMALMLGIQIFIFPPDLIREWPSLELDSVTIEFVDQLRIAALISTIGVLTGALGGGLESRHVIRHLALFRSSP